MKEEDEDKHLRNRLDFVAHFRTTIFINPQAILLSPKGKYWVRNNLKTNTNKTMKFRGKKIEAARGRRRGGSDNDINDDDDVVVVVVVVS